MPASRAPSWSRPAAAALSTSRSPASCAAAASASKTPFITPSIPSTVVFASTAPPAVPAAPATLHALRTTATWSARGHPITQPAAAEYNPLAISIANVARVSTHAAVSPAVARASRAPSR